MPKPEETPPNTFHEQFVPDVFKAELAAILERRSGHKNSAPLDKPDVGHDLVGLAFSGGGIRSATFNLGVVQVLDERGIFPHIDYLSTVSGGGYIGACISTILAHKPELPFRHRIGALEHAAFRHLRDYANYLAPGGVGKALRLPAILAQGLVRNLFAVMPIVFFAAAVLLWTAGGIIWWRLSSAEHSLRAVHWWPALGAAAVALLWTIIVAPLLYTLVQRAESAAARESPSGRRDRLLATTTLVYVLAVVIAFLNAQIWVVATLTQWRLGIPVLAGASAALTALTSWGLFHRAVEDLGRRFRDQLLFIALAALAPLTLWLMTATLASWAISPPDSLAAIFGVTVHDPAKEQGLPYIVPLADVYREAAWLYAGAGILLVVLFLCLYDVNGASLHSFYRDRLSRAYLFTYEDARAFDPWVTLPPVDRQKLSDLRKRPYHLVNAALNIQGSKYRNARGRNAHFFFFSPRFVGSDFTGYRATAAMEKADPHLDLAAAMAISGAAVSPNAGDKTNRATRALLGLANLRLGYWLPNPRWLKARNMRLFRSGASPYCFFLELLGAVNEQRRDVYLSDGGHIENLGVFELLRRRCRYIIASDAEADLTLSFNGLAQVVRLARIELGIQIRIDLAQLHRRPDGTVARHVALGTIEYGDGQTGHLLYLKASVSGDEGVYVAEYRARCPDFPHETTSDQFFDEAQFEAYRALGHHIAGGLFEDGMTLAAAEEGVVAAWFAAVARQLGPAEAPSEPAPVA